MTYILKTNEAERARQFAEDVVKSEKLPDRPEWAAQRRDS